MLFSSERVCREQMRKTKTSGLTMRRERRAASAAVLAAATGAATALTTASLVYLTAVRPRIKKWSATADEIGMPMPGDELSPHPRIVSTRAVTIDAPGEEVWPWLVQIGCNRAGWYSYDFLDNGGKPSAERIIPELQNLQQGDEIAMTPAGDMKVPVAHIEPGRSLTLGGTMDPRSRTSADINDPDLQAYFNWVMTYELEEVDPGTTRLVARNRADWNSGWVNNLIYGMLLEFGNFLMEQKMLRGIKARAERAHASNYAVAGQQA